MVAINSFTANTAGVEALAKITGQQFEELGFRYELIPSEEYGSHLVMTRPGKSTQKLGLVSHLDTVFPPEEEQANDFAWRVEGDKIYGPGTVDIKGGTALIYLQLKTMQALMPDVFEAVTWVILLSAAEERGDTSFGDLCRAQLGTNSLGALIYEGGRMTESKDEFWIVASRKGMATYQVDVAGKASHAGTNHPGGANAIVQLAEVIQKIAALTDYDRHLTFNVGYVAGGTVTNRVPHEAQAKIEMRTFEPEVFEYGIQNMLALNGLNSVTNAKGDIACQVKVQVTRRTEPWARNPATESLRAYWISAAKELGFIVHPEDRGGLSDGNHFGKTSPPQMA